MDHNTKRTITLVAGTIGGAALASAIGGFLTGVAGILAAEDRQRGRTWYAPDEWTEADTRKANRHLARLVGHRVVGVRMGGIDGRPDESLATIQFDGGKQLEIRHFYDDGEAGSDSTAPDFNGFRN